MPGLFGADPTRSFGRGRNPQFGELFGQPLALGGNLRFGPSEDLSPLQAGTLNDLRIEAGQQTPQTVRFRMPLRGNLLSDEPSLASSLIGGRGSSPDPTFQSPVTRGDLTAPGLGQGRPSPPPTLPALTVAPPASGLQVRRFHMTPRERAQAEILQSLFAATQLPPFWQQFLDAMGIGAL
jgi:hypothetical protein